jgi:hypothetical protein
MAERKVRLWTLMRGVAPKESYLFWVLVAIDEDRPGLWGATVAGLESRLVAMGASTHEAEHHAIELFRGMVDHALSTGSDLGQMLGSVPHVKTQTGTEDADKIFAAIGRFLDADDQLAAQGDDEWRSTPAHPGVMELAKELTV